MKIRITKLLLFLIAFCLASFSAGDGLAERTLAIKMGDTNCQNLSMSGKPANGGYHVEEVWSQSQAENVVNYSIDKDRGLICFEPVSIGSATIKVRGQRYELDRYGRQKTSEPFYRSFKVRVRP